MKFLKKEIYLIYLCSFSLINLSGLFIYID